MEGLDVVNKENPFKDAQNVEQLLCQLVGSASMCWEHVDRAGVFQSDRALEFSKAALDRFLEFGYDA